MASTQNRYAFGGDAADVTIKFLTVQNFGSRGDNNNEGVVNHDSAEGWTVESSTIQKNAGAGVMLGSGSRLIGNCLRDNGQYGFNAYHADGVKDVVLDGNEISGNNTDDWEKRQPGCGCTGGGKFWETNGAKVTDNYVHDNRGVGLWADSNNVGFRFAGNYISGNDAEGIMYETSYNAVIVNNTFVRNALVKGPTNPKFPASAIYLSESGSDNRVDGPYSKALQVTGNVFTDNWSGHRGLGERGSIRRIPRQHEHRRRHAGQPFRRHRRCLCQRSPRSRSSRSSTTAGGRHRTSSSRATLSRPTRRKSLAANRQRAAVSTGSFRTTAPIHAGRRTTGKSCRRTSRSSRTTSGGTTPTPGTGISWLRRPDTWSPGTRGDQRPTIRTPAAA